MFGVECIVGQCPDALVADLQRVGQRQIYVAFAQVYEWPTDWLAKSWTEVKETKLLSRPFSLSSDDRVRLFMESSKLISRPLTSHFLGSASFLCS